LTDHRREGVVGPIPPGEDSDAYDRRRRRILWAMPSGLYVLGSAASGRRNLMTLNWATQVATDPKLIGVSVEAGAYSHRLVDEGGVFSLNILRREDRAAVRRFVKPLDDPGGPELAGFAVRAETTGAPVLELAVAWLDCRVVDRLAFASHSLFIGEVVNCGWGAGAGSDGAGDDPPEVLRMEDTRMSYGG
jgi:flavin reductase (DIM6/NTAB) family NADH-FMN oxidoreductase RutF